MKLKKYLIPVLAILAFICFAGRTEAAKKNTTTIYCVSATGVKSFILKKGTLTIKLASNRRVAVYDKKTHDWKKTSKKSLKYRIAKNISYTLRDGSDDNGGSIEGRKTYKWFKQYFKMYYSGNTLPVYWVCECWIKVKGNKIIEVSLVDTLDT